MRLIRRRMCVVLVSSCFLYSFINLLYCTFFFFNDTATTEIYTLSLHDALPISTGEYETLGGYITAKIGKIPQPQEKYTIDNFEILIAKADHIKIDLVKLIVNEET